MRRLLPIVLVGVVAVAALMMTSCTSVTGGAPTNVTITAATDSTLTISWTAPTDGTPDKYYVAFMATGTSSYTDIDTTTATSYTHDPAGKTGSYKVTAVFGSTTYDAAANPSTAPIATSATTVSELNATGNSGFGWDRTAGTGSTYSMTAAGNAANVDFYITDFATGFGGTTYSIASPDQGPSDPGAVVPTGSWRVNAFSSALTSETAPLPVHSGTTYFNFTDLSTDPIMVACYTADGYYALAKLSSYNTGAGTVSVQTWFQPIKGLRLIQH
ncbi:MAG TPA: fibronectin type III domain-containing protein [bacterium]|nr:fibronectin type III domain-containing protein [bacterium]